jgi:hypothetical protein
MQLNLSKSIDLLGDASLRNIPNAAAAPTASNLKSSTQAAKSSISGP